MTRFREVAQWRMEGLADDAIAKKLDMTPAEVGRKLKAIHDSWLKLDPALSRPAAEQGTPSGWRLVLRVTAGPQKGRSFKFIATTRFSWADRSTPISACPRTISISRASTSWSR